MKTVKEIIKCLPESMLFFAGLVLLCILCFFAGRVTVPEKIVKIKIAIPDTALIASNKKDSIIKQFKSITTSNAIAKKLALEKVQPLIKFLDSTNEAALKPLLQSQTQQDIQDKKQGNINYDLVEKLYNTIDSLNYIIRNNKQGVTTKINVVHDTVFTYAKDPMIKDYYPTAKLKKIGFGQDVLPLYGFRVQGLANYNFRTNNISVGPAIRYDFNKFSFLIAGYYNIKTKQVSPVFNTRIDLIRF